MTLTDPIVGFDLAKRPSSTSTDLVCIQIVGAAEKRKVGRRYAAGRLHQQASVQRHEEAR